MGGNHIVLVEAESLGSAMGADYALDDASDKEYTRLSKVDGVPVRVTVVDGESHKQALRHSKLSKPA